MNGSSKKAGGSTENKDILPSSATSCSDDHVPDVDQIRGRYNAAHGTHVSSLAIYSRYDHTAKSDSATLQTHTSNPLVRLPPPRSPRPSPAPPQSQVGDPHHLIHQQRMMTLAYPCGFAQKTKSSSIFLVSLRDAANGGDFHSLDALKDHLDDRFVHKSRVKLTDNMEVINLCSLLLREVRKGSVKVKYVRKEQGKAVEPRKKDDVYGDC